MGIYYLAVDGGGTKTVAICAHASGAVVGRGLAGPTNLTSSSVGAASFNLIESIRQSVETLPESEQTKFPILVMGLAGLDSQMEYDEAFAVFNQATAHYKIGKFILVNDSVIALQNGSENKNALILISGTGSICYGRNEAGETAKVSGMDYLLADQASGYDIGRRVLREAVKSFDGRAQKSILEDLVCKHFKIATIHDLKTVVYHPPLTKIEVAELAPLCSQAFEANDQIAKEIFEKTIADIVIMVQTVIKRLSLSQEKFDLVFSGSIMSIPHVISRVSDILKSNYSSVNVVLPKTEPVFGALKIAMKEVD